MTDLVRAYTLPERYAIDLPIDHIVCDGKVDPDLVDRIRTSLGDDPGSVKAIVVIRHPKEEIYAVLDGHHRLHALRAMDASSIRASVVDDYIGLGFKLTRRGTFQPHPEFTKRVRVPVKQFLAFMERFLRDPNDVLKGQLAGLRKLGPGTK